MENITKLYSERHLGSKPRIEEEISDKLWKAIVVLIEKLVIKNFFAEAYPQTCDDNQSDIYATDTDKLKVELELYTNLSWPLKIWKDKEYYHAEAEPFVPSKYDVFDLLELLYSKTSTPKEIYFHRYFAHDHLTFLNDGVAKTEFSNEINRMFERAGVIYELNVSNGHIESIIGDDTKNLISDALTRSSVMDAEYCDMLQTACAKITSPRVEITYEALEKLWDAYERLKCYFEPENKSKKSESANKIVDLFQANSLFKDEVSAEMRALTNLGNTFRIRHSETYQATLSSHRQINYLFRRCLAIIVLIQDQITEFEQNGG